MTTQNYDFIGQTKKAFAPLGEFGELGAETFEKAVELQVELLSDLMDLTADQFKAAGEAEDVNGYIQEQTRLAKEYTGRAQKRVQAMIETATQIQGAYSDWARGGFEQARNGFEQAIAQAQPAKPATKKKAA